MREEVAYILAEMKANHVSFHDLLLNSKDIYKYYIYTRKDVAEAIDFLISREHLDITSFGYSKEDVLNDSKRAEVVKELTDKIFIYNDSSIDDTLPEELWQPLKDEI